MSLPRPHYAGAAAGVVVAGLALAALPFLGHAPNRIVPGQGISFAGGVPLLWSLPLAALLAAILVLAWRPVSAASTLMLAVLVATGLMLLPLAAGRGAALLATAAAPAARTSLGAGFWIAGAALLVVWVDLGRGHGLAPAMRLGIGAGVAALLVAAGGAGGFRALSLAREFAARHDRFLQALEQHLVLVAVSVGLAVLIGVPLGMQAVQRRGFGRRVLALLALVQTIPSIALFGLLIGPLTLLAQASPLLQAAGISGIGWAPAVIALLLYALLPLVAGTVAGLDSVPPGAVEAARGCGMRPRDIMLRVRLPLGAPVIVAGLRVALVQSIGLAIVTALIGAGGLGTFVFEGLGQNAPDLVLLGVIPVVMLALAADALLTFGSAALGARS